MDNVTLIIFTCEGREHLLPRTLESFKQKAGISFAKVILAIDGTVSKLILEVVNPIIVVQNYNRRGYIFNIINAISLVETEFFFWLEDDWAFQKTINLEEGVDFLINNPTISEITYSKYDDLSSITDSTFIKSTLGFSANPSLCRTKHILEAFRNIKKMAKDESTKLVGFESALSQYFEANHISCYVANPKGLAYSKHQGDLESTAREYHMINSLEAEKSDVGKSYISGFGIERNITVGNKIKMIPKLIISFCKLLTLQFFYREVYDYALRIVIASKKGFKC